MLGAGDTKIYKTKFLSSRSLQSIRSDKHTRNILATTFLYGKCKSGSMYQVQRQQDKEVIYSSGMFAVVQVKNTLDFGHGRGKWEIQEKLGEWAFPIQKQFLSLLPLTRLKGRVHFVCSTDIEAMHTFLLAIRFKRVFTLFRSQDYEGSQRCSNAEFSISLKSHYGQTFFFMLAETFLCWQMIKLYKHFFFPLMKPNLFLLYLYLNSGLLRCHSME